MGADPASYHPWGDTFFFFSINFWWGELLGIKPRALFTLGNISTPSPHG
jgi:hypothetical protein